MNWNDVTAAARPVEVIGAVDAPGPIRSIHYRAQDVTPGGLFVAVPGFTADGHAFVETALKNGAAAVVAPSEVAFTSLTKDLS